jgi:hypothetical protein
MLAAIERAADKTKPERLCVVRWTGRVRLHVEALTVCGDSVNVDDGVVQVPETVLTGRAIPSISDFGGTGRKPITICADCKRAFG